MFDSPRLNLPFLDAGQAQKHVTVNEALARLDALASGRVESLGAVVPPEAEEGDVHIPGAAAGGAWAGQAGQLAVFLNGGWVFVAPWRGAAFWVDDEAALATWTGAAWVLGRVGGSPSGAATLSLVTEAEVTLTGAETAVPGLIGDKAIVLGVTGRVTGAITGTGGWRVGVAGAGDRYGSGFGTAADEYAHGVTGQPQAYFGATDLIVTAEGGAFTGGTLRLAVHTLELSPPV